MKRVRCCLPVLFVLFTGCATARQADLERDLRDRALSQVAYRVPEASVWAAVRAVVAQQGFVLADAQLRAGRLVTDWKCSGRTCQSLKINVVALDADRVEVIARRTSYEGGSSSIVPLTTRAFDVEWALLQALDPESARAIAVSANADAAQALQTSASRWEP